MSRIKRAIAVSGIFIAAAVLGILVGFDPVPESHATKSAQTTQSILETRPGYDTLEEAGVHGIARAYLCSKVYECGGVIVQRDSDGKFVVGPVGSSHAGDHVYINYDIPPGGKMVADYHTHPCNPDTYIPEVFSTPDTAGDTAQRMTGFMGDLCTGNVHEFTPGKDSPNDLYIPRAEIYSTAGRIIGHIAVDGKSQEPNTGF